MTLEQVKLVPEELQTDGNRATVKVMLSYRVRGMSRPFRTVRRVTARKSGGRVARHERPSAPRSRSRGRSRRSARVRTRHVVLLAAPGVDTAPLRAGLEEAYREIRRDLPRRDLPRSVLVLAARDHRQAERLAGRIAKGVVAIANVSVEWGPQPALQVERVLAQRMVVIDSTWGSQDAFGRQSTLVHEMTHTALDPDTSAADPAVARRGPRDVRLQRRPLAEARARAAGAGPTIKLSAISRAGVDLPTQRPHAVGRLRGRVGGGVRDRRPVRDAAACSASTTRSTTRRSRAGRAPRRPTA